MNTNEYDAIGDEVKVKVLHDISKAMEQQERKNNSVPFL
jgi:hypothetical protein